MQLNPYLTFNGQCEEAFKFYEKALGGKIQAMFPYEATPAGEHVPADWGKKIMHAALVAGEASLLGSDAMPDKYQQPKGISVALHVKEPAEAERIFHALAENGKVTMPIQETFWALRFGTCADRFGIPWMINCAKPQ
jgi:PhnB protein